MTRAKDLQQMVKRMKPEGAAKFAALLLQLPSDYQVVIKGALLGRRQVDIAKDAGLHQAAVCAILRRGMEVITENM